MRLSALLLQREIGLVTAASMIILHAFKFESGAKLYIVHNFQLYNMIPPQKTNELFINILTQYK